MSDLGGMHIARAAVGDAHHAVAGHQHREVTGLAAWIEQLNRWVTRDSGHVHIEEITAER